MSFSENLAHLRRAKNMTQEQLAMLLGVSRQAVSKWESRSAYPEMDKLVRLSKIFACDLNELVTGDLTAVTVPDELAVPHDASPTDLYGYDGAMRRYAWLMAMAASAAFLGLAAFFGSGGLALWLPFPWFFLTLGCVVAGLLSTVAAQERRRFCLLHPCIEDFYTDADREHARRLTHLAARLAAAALVAGGAFLVLQSTYFNHLAGGLASACFALAVASGVGVLAWLMARRLDVGRFNRANADRIALEALTARDGSHQEVTLAEDPELARVARRRDRRRRILLAAGIMLVALAIGGILLQLAEVFFYLALIVGAVIATLAWLLYSYFA